MNTKKGMPPVDLGPSGLTVARAIAHHRQEQGLTYAELERRTEQIGHKVGTVALRRIEAFARRVDVDDLTSLAVALRVSPVDLLTHIPPEQPFPDELTVVTGLGPDFPPAELAAWMAGKTGVTTQERIVYWELAIAEIEEGGRLAAEKVREAREQCDQDPRSLDLIKRAHDAEGDLAISHRALDMAHRRLALLKEEAGEAWKGTD